MVSRLSSLLRAGWNGSKNRVTSIALDYRDVAYEVADKAQKRPFRAVVWSTGILATFLAFRTRPDKQEYVDSLLRGANEIALVAEGSRSKRAVDALQERRLAINTGKLRVVDLLFLSIVLSHPTQSEGCELYSGQCKLVRPPLLSFQDYILDVGVFGRWLVLERRLEHYDVNDDDL